jgi:N-acetylmuramoyl-L-alanine amidase
MLKRILCILALLCSSPAMASTADGAVAALDRPQFTRDIATDNRRQTLCLALNVYHEARGSTRQDQIAVAWVTRNRVSDRGTDYCRVIWEPRQFSWTVRSVGSLIPREIQAWHRSVSVAQQVMSGSVSDPTNGARNFRVYNGRGMRIGAHSYF